jgi:hypothetical protein
MVLPVGVTEYRQMLFQQGLILKNSAGIPKIADKGKVGVDFSEAGHQPEQIRLWGHVRAPAMTWCARKSGTLQCPSLSSLRTWRGTGVLPP